MKMHALETPVSRLNSELETGIQTQTQTQIQTPARIKPQWFEAPSFYLPISLRPAPEANPLSQANSSPGHSLRNRDGFWELTFAGREAIIPQDQALFYVAWLLVHPGSESVSARLLAETVYNQFGRHTDFRHVSHFEPVYRETHRAAILRDKQIALEALLDNEDECDQVKAEILRELTEIYASQDLCLHRAVQTAERVGETIASSLVRLCARLSLARTVRGYPHTILRRFGQHLRLYLLVPSCQGAAINLTSQFSYQPPAEISWTF